MGYFKNPSHFTTGFQASSLIGFFNKLYFFKITKKSQHLLDKSSSPPKPNCRWATLTEIAGCWPERGDEVWRRFQLGAHFVRSWGWTSHFFWWYVRVCSTKIFSNRYSQCNGVGYVDVPPKNALFVFRVIPCRSVGNTWTLSSHRAKTVLAMLMRRVCRQPFQHGLKISRPINRNLKLIWFWPLVFAWSIYIFCPKHYIEFTSTCP